MADILARLWPNTEDAFFRDRAIRPWRQQGLTCVATSLAIASGAEPGDFLGGGVNTQDPVSWSAALGRFGMKLAYLPTDIRKLRFYIQELIDLDDLFMLGFYTPNDPATILQNPRADGWLCGSHLVVLHRDRIYDPARGTEEAAPSYDRLDCHTKRIFRVVPVSHSRGL